MKQKNPTVEKSLRNAFEAADKFVSSRSPNELVTEIDLDAIKTKILSIRPKLESCEPDVFIKAVNDLLEDLGFPEFEPDLASRGLIVAKLQGLEVVTRLQEVKNVARAAGYRDPEAPNLDLSDSFSEQFMDEVNKSLNDLRIMTNKLDAQLKSSKQSGVSIGIGPFSMDIGVLVHFLEASTSDAQEYILGKARISAEILKTKLERINNSSTKLVDAVVSKTKQFGRKIVDLSLRIARVANKSYTLSLQFIKSKIESISNKYSDNNSIINEREIINNPSVESNGSATDYTAVRGVLYRKISRIRLNKRAPARFVETGALVSCEFIKSHSSHYLVFYFTTKPDDIFQTDGIVDPISVTEGLTNYEFDLLSSVSRDDLLKIARDAYTFA